MNVAKITVINYQNGKKVTSIYFINTITGQIVDPLTVSGVLVDEFPINCVAPC